jgi:hypothetical protein
VHLIHIIRLFIILYALILVSCGDPNPKSNNRSKLYVRDTILDGKLYELKSIANYNESGDKINSGFYIKNKRIGLHYYYDKDRIYCIRSFIYWPENIRELVLLTDSLLDESLNESLTCLNEAIYIDTLGKIQTDKSSFIDIKLSKSIYTKGDSAHIELIFYEPLLEIKYVYVILTNLTDTSKIRKIWYEGNKIHYSMYIGKNYKDTLPISGFAILDGIEKEGLPKDSFFGSRAVYIHKFPVID